MSDISLDEPKKEEIDFDEVYILKKQLLDEDIMGYSSQTNINTIDNLYNFNMSDYKKKKKKEKPEQVDEVKYNLFLMLSKKCRIDDNNYDDIIVDHFIRVKRLVIQELTIDKDNINFGEKEYIFIPEKKKPNFPYKNVILDIENSKYGDNKISGINDFPELKDLNDISLSVSGNVSSIDIKNKSNSNTNSLISDQSNATKSKGDSSENELIKGIKYYCKQKENNYFKFVYTKSYEKEIDGIYSRHDKIKLIAGKIDLKEETIKKLINEYNNKNDLKAHIIYKNFNDEYISENSSIILELKKNFDLVKLLYQIKKNSKIVNNLKCTNQKLPKYMIGILCSFDNNNVENQYNILNNKYNDSNMTILEHITQVINKNKVNFVIAAIKGEKIGDYLLGVEDYDINDEFKRVDIEYMIKECNINATEKDISEIKSQIKYESISKVKKKEIDMKKYNELISLEKEKNKIEEERKKLEEAKQKNKKEKNQIEEERKKLEEAIEKFKKEKKEFDEKKKE